MEEGANTRDCSSGSNYKGGKTNHSWSELQGRDRGSRGREGGGEGKEDKEKVGKK